MEAKTTPATARETTKREGELGEVRMTIEGPKTAVEAVGKFDLDYHAIETADELEAIVEAFGGIDRFEVQSGERSTWLNLRTDDFTVTVWPEDRALLDSVVPTYRRRRMIENLETVVGRGGAPVIRVLELSEGAAESREGPSTIVPTDGEVRELGFATYLADGDDGDSGVFNVERPGADPLVYDSIGDLVDDGWRID